MDKNSNIHPYLRDYIIDEFKKCRNRLEWREEVIPQIALFAKVGGRYETLQIPQGEIYFQSEQRIRQIGVVVNNFYRMQEAANRLRHVPFELLGVLTIMDTYIEDTEDAGKRITGGQPLPFVPKVGQQEALCAEVHTAVATTALEWLYTRDGNTLKFAQENLSEIPTRHTPAVTRMANLWPSK